MLVNQDQIKLNFVKAATTHFLLSVSLARPQLASSTEIPAEAKATTVFLSATSSTTSMMIKDSVPKPKIDFLNNHCSEFDKI